MLDQSASDELFFKACAHVIDNGRCSTSLIQRKLGIGYNKAAALVERMEDLGVVSATDHIGKRTVATKEQIEAVLSALRETEVTLTNESGETLFKGTAEEFSEAAAKSRMKETDADREVRDRTEKVTADRLRSFIERIERLNDEKKDIADQIKEVFAELKGEGFDAPAVRAIVKRRKQDADKLAEHEAVLDLYLSTLGMI